MFENGLKIVQIWPKENRPICTKIITVLTTMFITFSPNILYGSFSQRYRKEVVLFTHAHARAQTTQDYAMFSESKNESKLYTLLRWKSVNKDSFISMFK